MPPPKNDLAFGRICSGLRYNDRRMCSPVWLTGRRARFEQRHAVAETPLWLRVVCGCVYLIAAVVGLVGGVLFLVVWLAALLVVALL